MDISLLPVTPATSAPGMPSYAQLQAAAKPGDILTGTVLQSTPQSTVITVHGVPLEIPLPQLTPGTQLLLQVKANTGGLLFELLDAVAAPAAPNAAPLPAVIADEFIPSPPPAAERDPAAPTRLEAGRERPATPRTRPLSTEQWQTLAQRLRLPPTPANRAVVEALIEYRAPLNAATVRDTIGLAAAVLTSEEAPADIRQQAGQAARDLLQAPAAGARPATTPAADALVRTTVNAAALTMASELPPTPAIARAVRDLVFPLPEPASPNARVDSAITRVLARADALPPDAAAEVRQALAEWQRTFAPLEDLPRLPPRELPALALRSLAALQRLEQAVIAATRGALAGSETLVRLNTILETLREFSPQAAHLPGAAVTPESIRLADQWLDQSAARIPEAMRAWLIRLRGESPAEIARQIGSLWQRVAELERVELTQSAAFTELRQAHQEARGLLDRLQVLRLLNVPPPGADSTMIFAEIPLLLGAERRHAMLRVARRKSQSGGTAQDPLLVAICLELEHADEVHGLLSWLAGKLQVHFQVVSEAVRRAFAGGQADLREALTAMGYAADVSVGLRPAESAAESPLFAPWIADEHGGGGALDLKG